MSKQNQTEGYLSKFCNLFFKKKKIEEQQIEDNEPQINTACHGQCFSSEEGQIRLKSRYNQSNQHNFQEQEKSNQSHYIYQGESGYVPEHYLNEDNQQTIQIHQEIQKSEVKEMSYVSKTLYQEIRELLETINNKEQEKIQQIELSNKQFEKLLGQNQQMIIEINNLKNDMVLFKVEQELKEIDYFKSELQKFKICGEELKQQFQNLLNVDLRQEIQLMLEQLLIKFKRQPPVFSESINKRKQYQKKEHFTAETNSIKSTAPKEQKVTEQSNQQLQQSSDSPQPLCQQTFLSQDCILCKKQITEGFQITTECKHQYHLKCYEKMIETQLINESFPTILCYCKKKLNSQTLQTLHYYDSKYLKEKLFQNQLEEIKNTLKSKNVFQQCQTRNCNCFWIAEKNQDSLCINGHINQQFQEQQKKDSFITTLLFSCFLCQEKAQQGIQTPCMHTYHKECFQELISNQIKNNIGYIQCECKSKLKPQILTNFQIGDSEEIQEQLLKNQLSIIKSQVQRSGKKIFQCKNCDFFIISNTEEILICKQCQN